MSAEFKSQPFRLVVGFRQGCVLSPLLFLIYSLTLGTIWCCLHPLTRVFKMHLVGLQMRATKVGIKVTTGRNEVLCLSRKPVQCKWAALYCSRWRSSSTVPWGGIYKWRNTDQEIDTRRAGPSRCRAQCKTWARGPMQDLSAGPSEQWFYDVIVFSQPCYDHGRA